MKSQVWRYRYDNHSISVVNGDTTDLLVDDQLQDRAYGISFSARLTGALPEGKRIKVSLGSTGMKVLCTLFIDNVLQQEVDQ